MKNSFTDVLLQFQNQVKILHWQTKSYAQHQAFGMLYDEISDLTDEIAEVYMGKYGRVTTNGGIHTVNTNDVKLDAFLSAIEDQLLSFNGKLDPNRDSDILNLRDELLGKLNKVRYLLTLS